MINSTANDNMASFSNSSRNETGNNPYDYYNYYYYTLDQLYDQLFSLYPSLQPLSEFYKSFEKARYNLVAAIEILGIILNCLSIIILVRKDMRTPTNIILIALAVAHIIGELVHVSWFLSVFIEPLHEYGLYFQEMIYVNAFEFVFARFCYNTAVWLVVTLFVFQFISVGFPLHADRFCSLRRAKLAIALVVLTNALYSVPDCFEYEIVSVTYYVYGKNQTLYGLQEKDRDYSYALDYSYSNVMKCLPGLLLVMFPCAILSLVWRANRRRQRMIGPSENSRKESNQMTYMLSTIMVAFALAHLPVGVFTLARTQSIYISWLHRYLNGVLDLLSVINAALGFILYCAMSSKFRTAVRVQSFSCFRRCRRKPVTVQLPTEMFSRN